MPLRGTTYCYQYHQGYSVVVYTSYLDTLSFQHVRVRCLVRRSYGHPTDKTDYTLCKTNVSRLM